MGLPLTLGLLTLGQLGGSAVASASPLGEALAALRFRNPEGGGVSKSTDLTTHKEQYAQQRCLTSSPLTAPHHKLTAPAALHVLHAGACSTPRLTTSHQSTRVGTWAPGSAGTSPIPTYRMGRFHQQASAPQCRSGGWARRERKQSPPQHDFQGDFVRTLRVVAGELRAAWRRDVSAVVH